MTRRFLRTARRLAPLTLAVAAAGCHTLRFEIARIPPAAISTSPVEERKTYWLGGLFPTVDVDVATKCPNGAATIEEKVAFVDGLLALVTLTVYAPRTSYYYCRLEPYVPPPTAAAAVAPALGVTP